MNIYFSKKTLNTTEMKGNLTFLIPFDDTLTVSIYILIYTTYKVIK